MPLPSPSHRDPRLPTHERSRASPGRPGRRLTPSPGHRLPGAGAELTPDGTHHRIAWPAGRPRRRRRHRHDGRVRQPDPGPGPGRRPQPHRCGLQPARRPRHHPADRPRAGPGPARPLRPGVCGDGHPRPAVAERAPHRDAALRGRPPGRARPGLGARCGAPGDRAHHRVVAPARDRAVLRRPLAGRGRLPRRAAGAAAADRGPDPAGRHPDGLRPGRHPGLPHDEAVRRDRPHVRAARAPGRDRPAAQPRHRAAWDDDRAAGQQRGGLRCSPRSPCTGCWERPPPRPGITCATCSASRW